jgi:hypothetical protein
VANEEEPREPQEESGGPEELSQDPFVERVRPDPSEPPISVRVLQGLVGNSDREGYKRLYFSRELNSYAEFRQEDVLYSEPIPSEQPPFVGLDATRVGIRRDAAIEYTRVRAPRPVDEFDLDIRLMDPTRRPPELLPATWPGEQTCGTCETQCGATCFEETICVGFTCGGETQCGATCFGRTCQGTCNTCENTCGFNCIPTELPPNICPTRFGHAC